ncbi:AAA family ATPase [Streptomyces sp. NPDC087917]|uniref:ATP-binding protein n=1 Tax=Streptomyces sp. NPDC087917 TaxID=3155060 RepID=UPI003424FE44
MTRTGPAGREAELRRLDAVLDGRGDAGGPAVVDLTGAAGIGKSRLLTELCLRARARGMVVLRGRATEYERHTPFGLFTDAFADLDPDLLRPEGTGATAATAGPSAALVEAAAPVLQGTLSTPGGADTARRERAAAVHADRFAVHRATARLLAALSRTGAGLLIALDDLHWADPASLELLDHLVRHPLRAPAITAVARRDRQTSASLAAALTRGIDTGAVLRIELGPLPERACVEGLAPGLPPGRAARIYAASGGNPLYFLALLQSHTADPDPDAGSVPRPGAGPGTRAPLGGLGSLLLDELTPLTAAQRRTVEAVAVLGDHAAPRPLAELVGGTAADLDADLRALALRDLVRPGPAGSWTLRHPVLRSVVHENADPQHRVRMHRAAAGALARAGASAPVRAHHVEQALTGWDPAAAAVLLDAARLTADTAPASSAHWLAVVLRVLPDGPRHARRRLELMLARARALGICGELPAGRDLLRALIDAVPPDEDTGLRLAAVTLCASLERHLGRYAQAVALLRRELSRRPAPLPSDALALGLELGSCAPHSTPYPEVRADLGRTRALARRLGDGAAEADALALSALGEAYEGDLVEAGRFSTRADALLEALGERELALLGESRARLSATEFYLEHYAEAERHADLGLAVARRGGPPHILAHLLQCKANALMSTCRLPPALELVEEAETIARGVGSPDLLALALTNKAQVLLASRPPGSPEPLSVAEEAAHVAGARTSWWASLAWCVLGYAALYAGDPERARTAVLRAAGPDLAGLQPSTRPLFLEALATAAVASGDLTSARSWAARASVEAEHLGLPTQRASALRGSALVLSAQGRSAEAVDLYVRAAREAASTGATLWEAQSLLLGAAAAPADGAAPALWHRGRALAEAGGALLLTGLADQLGPPAPTAPQTPAPPPPPAAIPGLTPREREIAALVAEGLTTPSIAARLYVSPRTVDTHLAHIYRKTGITTRAALAALTARSTPSP